MNALLEGCLVDPMDLAKSGKRLSRALAGRSTVRITHPNGTDLEVALAGVPPRVYEGYRHPKDKAYSEFDMMGNFPDGRLRMALDAKTAEGRIVSNRRSYDEVGFPWTVYSGGAFEFSDWKLRSFSFEKGETKFARDHARGTPGRDRTGSLVIGLNPELRNVPYSEEAERGSVKLVVGGNTYSGGSNGSDLKGSICLEGSEISVDGTPFIRAGKIL